MYKDSNLADYKHILNCSHLIMCHTMVVEVGASSESFATH